MVHKQEVINKTKWFSTSEEHSQFGEWFRSSVVFICWKITEKKITILSNAYIHIYVEPDGLQSMGLQKVRHDWSDLAHMHMPWYMIHDTWQWLYQKPRLSILKQSCSMEYAYRNKIVSKYFQTCD